MTTIVLNTFEVQPRSSRSYLRGMAEAFNIRGNNARLYHFHESGEQADLAAVQNDWETVGEDLSRALNSVNSR